MIKQYWGKNYEKLAPFQKLGIIFLDMVNNFFYLSKYRSKKLKTT